jgi:hypothetical protein
MRILRRIVAVLLTLGLSLSPVAAGVASLGTRDCDRAQMMADALLPEQGAAQMSAADEHDCSCCKAMAQCSPAFCAAMCFGALGVLPGVDRLASLPHEIFGAGLVPVDRGLFWPPDPPPPRV